MSLADALRAASAGDTAPLKHNAVPLAIAQFRGTTLELATKAAVSLRSVMRAKAGHRLDPAVIDKLAPVLCLPKSAFPVRKRGRR